MDITEFGQNSLICGDSSRFTRWVPDNSFNHIVTDPPFGQGEKVNYGRSELGHRKIYGDGGLQWLPGFATESFRVTDDKAFCLVYWQWRTYSLLEEIMISAGWELKTVGIWDKKNSGLGAGLAEGYEQMCFFRKPAAREVKFRNNVFRYSRVSGRPDHPHEKPVNLHRDAIQTIAEPGSHIFDPYAGLYTVGSACMAEDMIYTGAEIDPVHAANGSSRFVKAYNFHKRQLSLRREALKVTQTKLIFK